MNRQSLGALVALNIVLLAALLVVALTPSRAQAQAFNRPQYLMVTGDVTGRVNESIVYVIDLTSARIGAIIFSSANNNIEVVTRPAYEMTGDLR
ncbi:MAG: hypothetical protein K8S99_03770 [Planctomycetes bacterium]|nr:hypothetical protein [Planctomycetota bacterium]